MALDPTIANALLQGQLAMHAVNDPMRVASLAASIGAQPPQTPPPVQVAQAAPAPAPTPPAPPPQPNTAQPAAPPPPPAAMPAATPPPSAVTPEDYTPPVTPEDYTPTGTLASLPGGPGQSGDMGSKLAAFGKALGAVAPPSAPNPPPAMHSSPPQPGSYNPAVVADFIAALQASSGTGKAGGLSPVSSLGKLIGG